MLRFLGGVASRHQGLIRTNHCTPKEKYTLKFACSLVLCPCCCFRCWKWNLHNNPSRERKRMKYWPLDLECPEVQWCTLWKKGLLMTCSGSLYLVPWECHHLLRKPSSVFGRAHHSKRLMTMTEEGRRKRKTNEENFACRTV